jgi:PAS domain S-box-containing protein
MPERVAVLEEKGLFRDVFDMSPDIITVADATGIILLSNRKACEISGYALEELIGKNSLEFIAPEERQRAVDKLKDIFITGEVKGQVFLYQTKDGTQTPIEITVRWYENIPGIGACSITIGRDIRDRIQYEKAYKTLLDNILHGIMVFQESNMVYANPSALRSLGFTVEEFTSFKRDDLFRLVHPDDALRLNQLVERHITSKNPQGEFHFRMFDKSGQLHWMESSIANIVYNGMPALQVSLLDTTGRKIAEDALRDSLQRYQALAEASPDGIYILDRQERFLYINRYGAKMMGKQPEEVIGQPRSKFFSEEAASTLRKARSSVYDTGQSVQVYDQVPTAQGLLWYSIWQIPLTDEQGEIVELLCIGRDVTAQKKAEETLTSAKEELEQRVSERTSELVASKEELKRLTKKIVNAQEEERRRVARELHDEAGQALITLKLNMASLRDELSTDQERLSEQISNSLTLIEETSKQIRALSHSLRPPVLDIAGINLSLEEYCNEFSSRTNIPVTYSGVNLPHLPDEISISLYRILQEGLTNIAKHAQATAVNVQLTRNGTEIWLTISDNGQGFDFQSPTDGIGLLGMRERLDLLNGKLTISAEPGKGASLTACVDWKDEGMA